MRDQSESEDTRYFYGKLLTVRDFEIEQSYFRGKDALINRLIHGGGIVCGLEVSNPQEGENQKFTTNLSAGVAIDCCGREIVVSQGGVVNVVGQLQDGNNYFDFGNLEERNPVFLSMSK